jgi:hypothetical protein
MDLDGILSEECEFGLVVGPGSGFFMNTVLSYPVP